MRKRHIASLALCGAVAMCAVTESRHAREISDAEARRLAETDERTPAWTRPSEQEIERRRSMIALASVSDPMAGRRADESGDAVWYGLDVLDVPVSRTIGPVVDEPTAPRTADQSCICIEGIRAGRLPPAPAAPKLSPTDVEIVPFGPWTRVLVGRAFSGSWSTMFDARITDPVRRDRMMDDIVHSLKTRFLIDRRAMPVPTGQRGGRLFLVSFPSDRPDGHGLHSRKLQSVMVFTRPDGVRLGVTTRSGLAPAGVIADARGSDRAGRI